MATVSFFRPHGVGAGANSSTTLKMENENASPANVAMNNTPIPLAKEKRMNIPIEEGTVKTVETTENGEATNGTLKPRLTEETVNTNHDPILVRHANETTADEVEEVTMSKDTDVESVESHKKSGSRRRRKTHHGNRRNLEVNYCKCLGKGKFYPGNRNLSGRLSQVLRAR